MLKRSGSRASSGMAPTRNARRLAGLYMSVARAVFAPGAESIPVGDSPRLYAWTVDGTHRDAKESAGGECPRGCEDVIQNGDTKGDADESGDCAFDHDGLPGVVEKGGAEDCAVPPAEGA